MLKSEPKLKGTAAKLADLIKEHGNFEFEGLKWLADNYAKIAKHLGVHPNTIKHITNKPPFKRMQRNIAPHGKMTLIRIGDEKTESDEVFILRKIWVTGLLYFNDTFAKAEAARIEYLQSQGADSKYWERLVQRVEKAKQDAKDLDKLKAGEKISLQVKPKQMGMLRGVVQRLGSDAPDVLYHLITYPGWQMFAAYIKADERETQHAHWPRLDWINKHPDVALDAYIDIRQGNPNKLDLKEIARLHTKIAKLAPKTEPEPTG